MIGETILQYQILEKLGAGGMGVVYKALDTKLNRTVALKFLPEDEQAGETDRARFLQEARAASAINHPNVCVIYDLKEHEGGQFIVMEYVEGRTLKQMTTNQELIPVEKAVDFALQISEAMQAAHEWGILHRDIKSENIMVTPSGQVKVMDFGLALVKGSQRLTRSSSTVGTIAYMSPEQIEGKPVDARADIFSFGVVFYEMLTGHLPFAGDNQAAVIHAILNLPPKPIESSQLAPDLIELIARALEKDVEKRCQSMQEMHDELLRIKQGKENSAGYKPKRTTVSPKRRKRSKKHVISTAALVCSLAVAAFIFFRPMLSKPLPEMTIVPFACSPGMERSPAFSPDGNQIAYIGDGGNQKDNDVYVKMIGTGVPLKLTRKPAPRGSPAWSPDGSMVTFLQLSGKESGIYKVPALGGVEQRLLAIDSTNVRAGLDWSPDGGSIVYSDRDSANVPNGIFLLSLSTMEKHQITFPPLGTAGDDEPTFSPNGKRITFRREYSYGSHAVFVIPTTGGAEKRITEVIQFIFDLAWAQNGREIIYTSDRGGTYSLWRVSVKNRKPKPLAASVEDAFQIAVAKKGTKLAYAKMSGSDTIWKGDIPEQEGQMVATRHLIGINRGHWLGRFSPDGQRIAFSSMGSGNPEVWICDNDGSNPLQLTDFGGHHTGSPYWSPDGRRITFDSRPEGHSDIFTMNADGRQLERMTTELSDDRIPSYSRDGSWIYFTSNRGGSYAVWKCPAAGGEAVQVTNDEGWWPCESPDGRSLYYLDVTGKGNVWKLSLEDGKKQIVLNDIVWQNWYPAGSGIYYLKETAETDVFALSFLNLATNGIKNLAHVRHENLYSLDMSPDRKSFIISEEQRRMYDIYLVENFR
jgi:eukaryotic-like serine/threonine-protein kinase